MRKRSSTAETQVASAPEQTPLEPFTGGASDMISFEQVGLLLTRFSEIIVQETPERYCTNILKRADKLSRSFGVELKREATDDWR